MRVRPYRRLVAASLMVPFLCGCAGYGVLQGDRGHTCRFAVEDKVERPIIERNPFSSPVGGLAGAGVGALEGLRFGLYAIVMTPVFAAIGAGAGTVCALAGLQHPTAEADFEQVLQASYPRVLRSALEDALNAPRPECSYPEADGDDATPPDAIMEIEQVSSGLHCLFGQQQYWIDVQWRLRSTRTGEDLAKAKTRCVYTSSRKVDEWLAHPDEAKSELANALRATGRRIARNLFGETGSSA